MGNARGIELAQELSGWILEVFAAVDSFGKQCTDILEPALQASPPFAVSSLAREQLRSIATTQLVADDGPDGAGVIFQRDLMLPSSPALEWWVRFGDDVERQEFVNDPSSPLFYDFEQLEWFRGGFGSESRTIAGPYIDYLGVNDYISTWTIPLVLDNKTVGVVGFDLKIATLEQLLIPKLLSVPNGRAALINETGQVIVGTIGQFSSGALVEAPPKGYVCHRVPVDSLELKLMVEAD